VKAEIAKLEFLRGMDAHTLDLSVLPTERRRFLATVGRRLTSQALQRREPERPAAPPRSEREGVPLGWMAGRKPPTGAVLAELGEDEQNPDAVPLAWQARQRYLILRTPEAPEL
jgi:hypothetical protein